MVLQFWLHSQLARIAMMFLAICTGVGLLSTLQMFLSGFAFEIAALCFLAEVPISQSALRRQKIVDEKFLLGTLLSKELLPTLISVGITALTVIVITLVGVLPQEAARTYFFFALFLLQICILCRIAHREKTAPEAKRILLFGGVPVAVVALLTVNTVQLMH